MIPGNMGGRDHVMLFHLKKTIQFDIKIKNSCFKGDLIWYYHYIQNCFIVIDKKGNIMKKLLQLMAFSLITMMSYNIYCPPHQEELHAEKPQPHMSQESQHDTEKPHVEKAQPHMSQESQPDTEKAHAEKPQLHTPMPQSSMPQEPQLQIVMPTTGGPYQIYEQSVDNETGQWLYGSISPVKGNAISKSSLKEQKPYSYMRYFLALPSDKKEIPGTSRTGNELINATKWVFSPNGKSNTINTTSVIMPTTGGPYGVYMQQCAVNTKATCDSWQGQPVSAVIPDNNNYYFAGTTIYDRYFLALTSDQKEIPGTSRTGNEFVTGKKWALNIVNTIS